MMKALVDVVIPTFNRASVLEKAIRSVFNQSFQFFRLWIVDDGSTDHTQVVLDKWKHLSQIQVLSLSANNGVSVARNRGIRAGQADWVAFLDSDDEWKPNKLEIQMRWIKQNPHYPLVHTNEIWIRNGRILNQKKKHQKKGGRIFKESLSLCCMSPSSVLIQRKVFNKIGFFREDFPVCEDYEMWLRITSHWEVGFIEQPLIIKHGGHVDQLSRKYKAMDEWRVRAMADHLYSNKIHKEERKELIQVLLKKCQILLNGYKKYNNFTNQKEIQIIYEKTLKIYQSTKSTKNLVSL